MERRKKREALGSFEQNILNDKYLSKRTREEQPFATRVNVYLMNFLKKICSI